MFTGILFLELRVASVFVFDSIIRLSIRDRRVVAPGESIERLTGGKAEARSALFQECAAFAGGLVEL